MNFTELFIRRPVMTTLATVALLIFGIAAYRKLPVSDLPNVDFPTITVSANLPGASPQTMASSVATPLEKQFSTIAGITDMSSSSSLGSTSITLQFALDRDIDAAAQDVQAAISATLRSLPQGIIPPSFRKSNPASSPILYVSLTSKTIPLSELDEYGETMMGQRISTVPGVAQVSVFGAQKYAVRIQLDPAALASRGIGTDEVSQAISSSNVNQPTGVLWGRSKAYTLQASGQLTDADQFRQMTIAYRNGAAVRLGDVANVLDGVENTRVAAWLRDQRSVTLAIQRQPGTNTVEVANAVKKMLPQLEDQLPAGVELKIVYDRSQSIGESVRDVKFTLLLTLALVIMVIFLFLRSLSATVIPSLALPMSMAGTFAAMWALGYSLDNLSLMAITLAVGFVVDDAIVMLENIVRHLEMGKPPLQASLDGAKEVGFTILSMTISLTAVFIPLLFMGGVIGMLFREFAVTIAVSILVSGVVSLTLTPMLCSRFLKAESAPQHHAPGEAPKGRGPLAWFERGYDATLAAYERTLKAAMRRRRVTIVASLLLLVGTVVLFRIVPKGFIDADDTGQITGSTEAAQGTSFEAMVQHQREAAAIVAKDPNIETFISSVGQGGGSSGSNQGRFVIRLKERGKRLPADDVIKELNRKLSGIPGLRVFLQNPPAINIGGRQSKSLYQFTLQSSDLASLYRYGNLLEREMRGDANLQDVTSDLQVSNPQVQVEIDRDRAAALGVTAQAVESALYDAYGSRQVSTIFTPTNQYFVIMELLPQFQSNPDALNLLYVRSKSSNALVPLSSVTKVTNSVGPLSVTHSGQVPSVTISFNLRPGVSLSQGTEAVQSLADKTLPGTIVTQFSGTAQAFQDSQQGLLLLLGLAIFVIYVVLGILYESFIHPLTILSGLPSAAFGALLALLVFRLELSVYGFVGLVLLIGLVKKNAIMMIDFAVAAERDRGMRPADAIFEACIVRFRPIMMTTAAAVMGTLPIALGIGAGAASRRPLGVAVVGGLAISQVITLYITPVVYTYFDSLQDWLSRRRLARSVPNEPNKPPREIAPARPPVTAAP
ncbi:MAG TPA: efflux RND transporter permease subunit [Longimicrobiaceae bacterium]|jgi:HAE1 family hydrophobic/amphiphilic exporter-1|nr:efflux RND transporter permease subunit [Longimicrobiaceae bacterium]